MFATVVTTHHANPGVATRGVCSHPKRRILAAQAAGMPFRRSDNRNPEHR